MTTNLAEASVGAVVGLSDVVVGAQVVRRKARDDHVRDGLEQKPLVSVIECSHTTSRDGVGARWRKAGQPRTDVSVTNI